MNTTVGLAEKMYNCEEESHNEIEMKLKRSKETLYIPRVMNSSAFSLLSIPEPPPIITPAEKAQLKWALQV